MATTITKLFPTGILQSSVQFDEVSLSSGSLTFNVFQYLTAPSNSNFILGATFTIEAWIYITTLNSTQGIVSLADSAQWSFGISGANKLQFRAASTSNDISGATTLTTGVWYHCAVVATGTGAGQLKLYLNGILDGSGTITAYPTQFGINVGCGRAAGGNPFYGNITNLRIVSGTAVYTSNFTPIRLILSAITNTVLLLNVTDSASAIKDNSLTNSTLSNIGAVPFSTNNPYVIGTEKIKVSTNAVNALMFDEVNLPAGTAERRTNTGTYMVSGYFDEYTYSVSPF